MAACAAVIYYWEYIEHLKNYGYIGAFFAGFIAGSSLPLPLPYLVVNFTLGSVLNPALVGVSSGVGAGIGGTLVYLLGRGGSNILPKLGITIPDPKQTKSAHVSRFHKWAHQRGSVVVFIMSALLNPAFAPMAITMGTIRFRLAKFFLWCTAGNIVKSMLISYCGYFGLGALLRWTGAL
ncbi:VTT domain-containing protein [Chloroflexota bacterium]